MLFSRIRKTTLRRFPQYRQCLSTVAEVKITEKTPKTFSLQSQLPRLPIPSLEHTLSLYRRSLVPIFSEATVKEADKIINDFMQPDSIGQDLQRRLYEYETKQKHSWLETIWLNKGYLEYREPNLLNVNWWCQLRDHPQGLVSSPPKGETTLFQLERSAGIITGLLNLNDSLNREEFPPEFRKDSSPLCMNQYKQQIGTTRIALPGCDRIDSSFPCLAQHMVVSYKSQLIRVPVYGSQGERAKIEDLVRQLKRAVDLVDNLKDNQIQPPVGILTGEHRDIWAKARENLEKDPNNAKNLSVIDRSLAVLCLEDYSPSTDVDISHHVLFHGTSGRNRWFDKAIQIILTNNGRGGINGEHTPADAAVPGGMFSYIAASEPMANPIGAVENLKLEEPSLLTWNLDESTSQTISQACTRVPEFISEIRSVLLHYNNFGSKSIKASNTSPDAFMQMALQLAYYRLHGEVVPTYETAATRAFLHGRTETTRSCSIESKAFVQIFDDKSASKDKKIEAFKLAISSHLNYMKKAARGQGVDRHLLGLRCMLEKDEAFPELFLHSTYLQSMNFILSTSNSSPGTYSYGGFAPVVSNGYGINYAIDKNDLKFSMSRWARQGSGADEFAMRVEIKKALDDLALLLSF